MPAMAVISSRLTIRLARPRWRRKGPRTVEDRAGVLGAGAWKIALEVFRHMEKEGFRFPSDRQVTLVLSEFIAFLVQLADRAAHAKLGEAGRAALIGGTVKHLAATMENNQLDLFGPGQYRQPFIDLLNTRFGEYALYDYTGDDPGYPCLRFFAGKVAEAMAASDDKWVVEQMIDIEAPEMVRVMKGLASEVIAAPSP